MVQEYETSISGNRTLGLDAIFGCFLGPLLALDTVTLAALSIPFCSLFDSGPHPPHHLLSRPLPQSLLSVTQLISQECGHHGKSVIFSDTWSLLLLWPLQSVIICVVLFANVFILIDSQL